MKNTNIKEQVADSNGASNKTLLPDNVNTPEEYLEYLDAIGYWAYVERLEKLKEQMIFLLEHEFKSAYMDGQLEPKVKAQKWFKETYGGNK
jgi:hypothetical protein